MENFGKKLMSGLWDILRSTNGHMDGQGSLRVNPGSKVCNNVINWFTSKYLKKNWKTDKFLLKIFKKSLHPYFNHLNNPRLRFSQNIAPYSNDVPYFLLPPCKKLETLMTSFEENFKKPDFWHLISRLGFFSKFRPCHFLYFIDFMQSFRKNCLRDI